MKPWGKRRLGALERVRGHEAARAAAGPNQRHDLVTPVHGLEKSREREAGIGQPPYDVVAAYQRRTIAMGGEVGEVGLCRDEAIRLVMKPRDGDACHSQLLSMMPLICSSVDVMGGMPARFCCSTRKDWLSRPLHPRFIASVMSCATRLHSRMGTLVSRPSCNASRTSFCISRSWKLGASRKSTFLVAKVACSRRTTSTALVERSNQAAPARKPATRPSAPRPTSSTSAGVGSEVNTRSQASATARGVGAQVAPFAR